MEELIEEMIKDYKTNITAQLEQIGVCADNLLSSKEAQANNKLFRNLTIILSAVFKTYLSTSYLDVYLYEPNANITSAKYYSDFKGYKTGIYIIVSFINKLNGFNAFKKENSKEKLLFQWLKDLNKILNNEMNTVQKIYKILNNNQTEVLQ